MHDASSTAAAIIAIFTFANTVLIIITNWMNKKTAAKVEEVHKSTNGMKQELVEATERAAKSEGIAAGMAQGRETREDLRARIIELEKSVATLSALKDKG